MLAAADATLFAIPDIVTRQVGGGTPPDTKHVMGGMQMGVSPQTSVTDRMANSTRWTTSTPPTAACSSPPAARAPPTRSWQWRYAPRAGSPAGGNAHRPLKWQLGER